jgi:hypothetical protein
MANIIVSASTTNINVDTTTSTVDVSSTISNVLVGETTFVANNIVRAAISVANNGGDGSLSYNEPTGVITYNGVTAAETRAHFSGASGVDYNSTTGVITADTAEIRGFLGNTLPITYDASTGVIGLEQTLDDLTLKKYQETVVNNGTLSGDISVNIANGTIHELTLGGNITGITLANISTGGSATLLITQDGTGSHILDTTTTPANWTNWNFTNSFTEVDPNANHWNALNVLYDGSKYYATLITQNVPEIDNFTAEQVKIYIETNGLDMENTITSNSNISTTADISASGITATADISASGITATANISASGITATANISASGNVSANTFKGIGLESDGVLDVKFNADGSFDANTFSVSNSGGVLTNTFQLNENGPKYFRVGTDSTGDGQVQTGSLKIYGDSSGGNQTSLVIDSGNAVIAGIISAGSLATDTHTFTGNVDVTGNIEVSGNLNYRNVEDLYVRDQSITLNANAETNATVEIIANRPLGTSTQLRWNEISDKWQITNDGSTFYDIPTSTSDLAEGTNLYYTDGRFDTRFATKSTTDLSEGTNLYYTTARQNTDFDTRLGTKSTSDLAEGTNLYYTDTRSRSAVSVTTAAASGDGALAYDSGTGVFTFTPADAGESDYGNVQVADFLTNGFGSNTIITTGDITASDFLGNSITATGGFTINSGNGTTVTSKFGINNTVTETANIAGKGFGVFNYSDGTNVAISYSGTDSFEWHDIDGSTVAGSTTLTITSVVRGIDGSTGSITDLNVGQIIANGSSLILFPDDAYVVSINSGAGTVEMSQAATQTASFTHTTDGIILDAGIVDTTTGLVIKLLSQLRTLGGGSATALYFRLIRNTPFGYPASGPVPTDFDIITTGSASDYTMALTPFMMGQTPVTNNKTALNAPLGITIGENTQLTNRGEKDIFKSFGMNMLWDGLDSDLLQPIQPQVLFKSYTDNSQQKPAVGSVGLAGGAPRLFFSTANGNASADGYDAYPRASQELGRLSFWGSTGEQLNPSSYNVPGFISVAAADNWDTWGGGTAGNTNVYMGATSNGVNPDTYLSYKGGELFLGSADLKPVTLAPAHNGSASDPSGAYNGSPTKWAEASYAQTSGSTSGAKFTVTNGGSAGAGTVGDMQLSLKRNDNSSTEATNIRSIFSGSSYGFLEDDAVMFTFDGVGSALNNKTATVSASGTITVSSTGNETGLAGNQYTLTYVFASGTISFYYVVGGGSGSGGRIHYSDIGGTTPAEDFVTQTVPSTVTTVVTSGVTAKEWKFNLEEQSDDLKIQSDGTTVMHFTDQRVHIDEVFRLQNLTNTQIAALTATAESGDTVYASDEGAIVFYDGTNWQKITSSTFNP